MENHLDGVLKVVKTPGDFNKYSPPGIYCEIEIATKIYHRGGVVHDEDYEKFCRSYLGQYIDIQLAGLMPFTKEHFFDRRRWLYNNVLRHMFDAQNIIFIFGMAEVWQDADDCFWQVPARGFKKANTTAKMLSVPECKSYIQDSINTLRSVKADTSFILMVSPLAPVNTATTPESKAILVTACKELAEENNGVDYFPLYEDLIELEKTWPGRHIPKDVIKENAVDKLIETYFDV